MYHYLLVSGLWIAWLTYWLVSAAGPRR